MLSDMESDRLTSDPTDAAAQLAALRAQRQAMADRVRAPWWYDVALGGAVFLCSAAVSLRDTRAWQLVALGTALLLIWVVFSAYRRTTGVWVNGLRRGRTRRTLAVWFPLYAVVMTAGLVAELRLGLTGAMAAAGVVLGVAFVPISRWWMRIYAAELRELS